MIHWSNSRGRPMCATRRVNVENLSEVKDEVECGLCRNLIAFKYGSYKEYEAAARARRHRLQDARKRAVPHWMVD